MTDLFDNSATLNRPMVKKIEKRKGVEGTQPIIHA